MAAVAREVVAPALQQAVQGAAGMGAAGGGPQPGGGLAGGGGQVHAGGGVPLQHRREHAGHGAGLAGARSPLEQHQPVSMHRLHGLPLAGIQALGGGRRRHLGRRPRPGGGLRIERRHPLQKGREHRAAQGVPTAPAHLAGLDHQGPVRGAAEGRAGQALRRRPRRQGQDQDPLLQGHHQLADQPGHSPINRLAIEPWQGLQQGQLQGLQPGRLLPLAPLHRHQIPPSAAAAPPARLRSRARSRARIRPRGGRSTTMPGTAPGRAEAASGPGVPRRNT